MFCNAFSLAKTGASFKENLYFLYFWNRYRGATENAHSPTLMPSFSSS